MVAYPTAQWHCRSTHDSAKMFSLKPVPIVLLPLSVAYFLSASCMAGHYFHMEYKCRFKGEDLNLVETYQQCLYDKVLVMVFNRSTGFFTGHTQWTSDLADMWNGDDRGRKELIPVMDGLCRKALALNKHLRNAISQPYIKLHQVIPCNGRHPAMLQCSVYGFYPKQITVSWRNNGQKVSTGVTSTQVLSDSQWSYQAHSRLVLSSLDAGQRISCVVEHASLSQPEEHHWDPSMSTSDIIKVVFGATTLLLGCILFICGVMYYKTKVSGLGYCSCNTS